jgi:Protein of unknown function (DUF3035)
MIGYDRTVVGRDRFPLLTVACLALILLLPGCTGLRRSLGMEQVGPDEFAVESRAPLTIPPDFDLRPPQPGAPRPQEVTAAEKARKVIDTAGPGEPGKQATSALKTPDTIGGGSQIDPNQQVGQNSLASKLLGSTDSATGGTVENRETKPLKGVY